MASKLIIYCLWIYDFILIKYINCLYLSIYLYACNFVMISFEFTDLLQIQCICFMFFKFDFCSWKCCFQDCLRRCLLLSLIPWLPSLGLWWKESTGSQKMLWPPHIDEGTCTCTDVHRHTHAQAHTHHACTNMHTYAHIYMHTEKTIYITKISNEILLLYSTNIKYLSVFKISVLCISTILSSYKSNSDYYAL